MSSQTASPDVPVDDPWVARPAAATAGSPAEAGTDSKGDDLPFESPEFGVEGFLPHLDAASDV